MLNLVAARGEHCDDHRGREQHAGRDDQCAVEAVDEGGLRVCEQRQALGPVIGRGLGGGGDRVLDGGGRLGR
jgi:hypothetical protein